MSLTLLQVAETGKPVAEPADLQEQSDLTWAVKSIAAGLTMGPRPLPSEPVGYMPPRVKRAPARAHQPEQRFRKRHPRSCSPAVHDLSVPPSPEVRAHVSECLAAVGAFELASSCRRQRKPSPPPASPPSTMPRIRPMRVCGDFESPLPTWVCAGEGSESESTAGSDRSRSPSPSRSRSQPAPPRRVAPPPYHPTLAPRGYDFNNPVVRRAVADALKLQGDSVRLSKVQAYVLEALGVKPTKQELRPVVEALLMEEARQARMREATCEGDRLRAAGYHGEAWSLDYLRWLMARDTREPDASPFDGVTKITKDNAWRYEHFKPTLHKYRDQATRTQSSEPGRFYRQVMGEEWDGRGHSFDLAGRMFRKLVQQERQRTQVVSIASAAAMTARSTTVSTADAPTAAETVTPAAETAGLAHLQPLPPPSKPPPSLPPSPPDTDGEEGSEEEATPPDVPRASFLDDYDHRIREREAKEASQKFNRAREVLDGSTRITAENAWRVHAWVPSLHEYRDKSKRAPDSLPARFYRMMMGEEWDGNAHSYSLASKKLWRLLPPNRQDERERQQRKKRDYSKKKRPADDSQRRQARRKAQREREKACVQQQKQVGA